MSYFYLYLGVGSHTRKQADTQAQQEKRRHHIENLYRQLQSKKHLSSYTFRYRPEELDELESIFTQIERDNPLGPGSSREGKQERYCEIGT